MRDGEAGCAAGHQFIKKARNLELGGVTGPMDNGYLWTGGLLARPARHTLPLEGNGHTPDGSGEVRQSMSHSKVAVGLRREMISRLCLSRAIGKTIGRAWDSASMAHSKEAWHTSPPSSHCNIDGGGSLCRSRSLAAAGQDCRPRQSTASSIALVLPATPECWFVATCTARVAPSTCPRRMVDSWDGMNGNTRERERERESLGSRAAASSSKTNRPRESLYVVRR